MHEAGGGPRFGRQQSRSEEGDTSALDRSVSRKIWFPWGGQVPGQVTRWDF